MTTINGPITLDFGTSTQVLDFDTGLAKNVIIVRHGNQKCIKFVIQNEQYYLGFDWKILQIDDPRGYIPVSEIFLKKIEIIKDKFNKKHTLADVKLTNDSLGIPENLEIWYDKRLVILK